jgi:hypothetical protein
MKSVAFFTLFTLVLLLAGCASTLNLRSGQVDYERSGLGELSPMEVGMTDYTMANADFVRAGAEMYRARARVMEANPWLYFGWGSGSPYLGWGSSYLHYYYPYFAPSTLFPGGGHLQTPLPIPAIPGGGAP